MIEKNIDLYLWLKYFSIFFYCLRRKLQSIWIRWIEWKHWNSSIGRTLWKNTLDDAYPKEFHHRFILCHTPIYNIISVFHNKWAYLISNASFYGGYSISMCAVLKKEIIFNKLFKLISSILDNIEVRSNIQLHSTTF